MFYFFLYDKNAGKIIDAIEAFQKRSNFHGGNAVLAYKSFALLQVSGVARRSTTAVSHGFDFVKFLQQNVFSTLAQFLDFFEYQDIR